MKKIVLFLFFLYGILSCMGQVPSRFSYQAVVRNAGGQLLANQSVGVRVSVLEGSSNGNAVFVETHNVQTDASGVLALSVGTGNASVGNLGTSVHWGTASNFLKVEIDPAGGSSYSITSVQELVSVPYALYAKSAGNGFSGNYNDLYNKPTIPFVPTNVSYFNNDAHYLTEVRLNEVMDSVLASYVQTIDSLSALVVAQASVINGLADALDTLANGGFRCGIYKVADFDGNEYHTLQLGNQCWMKENLRTTHYSNGMPIPMGSTSDYANAYRYYPNNQSVNMQTCGLLYNWTAVMSGSSSSNSSPSGVQGICPNGWHLPSETEWGEMLNFLLTLDGAPCNGNGLYVAKALASTTGWVSSTGLCAVGNEPWDNNVSGFTAMPAGSFNGIYNAFASSAYFWSSTEVDGNNAYQFGLFSNSAEVNMPVTGYGKNNAMSVRCVLN